MDFGPKNHTVYGFLGPDSILAVELRSLWDGFWEAASLKREPIDPFRLLPRVAYRHYPQVSKVPKCGIYGFYSRNRRKSWFCGIYLVFVCLDAYSMC